uniref:C2H2-type domain-containing protein n=1 Tax=Haemonchus placei TaxID=6290 RepID=A0A0N4X402_HAEPC
LKLQPDSDCVALFQFALSQGICDISFVTSPYEFFTELRDSSASPRTSRLETVSPPLITPSTSHTSSSAQLPPTLTANNDQNSSSSETVPGGFSNPDDGQTASSRCASIESATPPPASMDHFNTVLSTLFGKGEPAKDVRIINGPPPKATSPPPEIPGPGQIKCRLCGITVSCKKIANLTAHALKIHTPVPLWKCPKRECEFDHADFTRVRSHIRTSHPELQGEIPRDNRNSVTVPEAQRYLAHCYPSIDWAHQYANIFPTVKKDSKEQSQTELRDPASEWYTVIDESNLNTPVQCSACRLMVALNKHSIEDHVKTMHSSGRPYQCGICKYTSVEEWKVRVHASIKHPETPCLQMLTLASHSKPYLYIRELFPDIAALLPEDEVDEMLYGFRQLNPSVLLSVPTSLNSLSENVADNTVVDSTSCFDLKPTKPPTQLTEETTPMLPDPFQTIFLELLNNQHTPLPVKPSPIRKNHNSLSVERFGSRVECAMCKAPVESKRTMLVGHAKSHCPQRQWQCPHCETTAAFHSKLKLHVQNAHKSDAEPMDMYSAELENKWLELFRQCFPQFAQQCFVEEWKFRSKQQQHLHSISADDWNPRGTDGGEQLRRTILIEPEEPRKEVEEKPENHHNTSSNGLQHHSIPSQPFCNNSASV